MRPAGSACIGSVLLIVGAARSPAAMAQPVLPATGCRDCHEHVTAPGSVAPVDDAAAAGGPQTFADLLGRSVHPSLDCTDCHSAVTIDENAGGSPHGRTAAPVNCAECHEDEAEVYRRHGRLEVGSDPDLPRCWSCHDSHEILHSSDRHSPVHPTNLPDTCRKCHANVDMVEKHLLLRDAAVRLYDNSVHGRASKKGLYVSATCNDCHSATDPDGRRTAHRILGAGDPESTINHFNIPDTCGRCHENVTQDYWEGIHGQFVKRGSVSAPVCTNCHGEHGIISPDDPLSPVSAGRLAEQTCSPCHESAALNEKYGVQGGRLASYIDSYHGLKSKAGDVTVANCASCHGSHRILPSSDAESSIHAANLQHTCGECHPKISAELAQTKIHETAFGQHAGWPEFFRQLYIVLIVVTIGAMLLHNGADWLRYVKNMGKKPFVQRFSPGEVAQHWVLMISFTVLVITGFSLRFSEAGWVKFLFGWKGGFELRGIIHRVAAVVMVLGAVWHALYWLTERGRHWFRDITARRSDLLHLWQNIMYFLGRRGHPPAFKRFTYMEKAEYWALVWGTVIMTGTGVLLWFDNFFVEVVGLPKGILNVALVIHYYEAWLAFLAILVWHLYGVLFKPQVYPMNPSWISGRMPKEMYAEEHADGPRLKARAFRIRYDVEEPSGQTGAPDAEGNGQESPTADVGMIATPGVTIEQQKRGQAGEPPAEKSEAIVE